LLVALVVQQKVCGDLLESGTVRVPI
jgi:hypothetical protein